MGATVGMNISNYAEYQCKLSLNNIRSFVNMKKKK